MGTNWIPVSERLPEFGERVLISTGTQHNTVKIATFDKMFYDYKGRWYCENGGTFVDGFIDAWMPLPEPYSEEKQAGLLSDVNHPSHYNLPGRKECIVEIQLPYRHDGEKR